MGSALSLMWLSLVLQINHPTPLAQSLVTIYSPLGLLLLSHLSDFHEADCPSITR